MAEELPQGRIPRVRQVLPTEEALAARSPVFRTLQLSPIFKTPAEVRRGSPLFWDMTEDVILLYDREGFLQEQLAGVKRRLEELKASSRLKILDVPLAEADYSDVIREAQEVVELAAD